MIEVEGAGVAFGETWIVRHLSFAIARGEILAVLGRNGQGKTTLLRALLGLQPLSEGTARIGGSVGYVPQRASLPFAYSVLDVVLMGRARHLGMFAAPGKADHAAARAALQALGMLGFATRRIDQLSGGEQQLVLIARALASECDALILDEPTSALDFRNQDLVLSTIRQVSRQHGLTVVFASHYPQHALHVGDKAPLDAGRRRLRLRRGGDRHERGSARTTLRHPDPQGLPGARRSARHEHGAGVLVTRDGRRRPTGPAPAHVEREPRH